MIDEAVDDLYHQGIGDAIGMAGAQAHVANFIDKVDDLQGAVVIDGDFAGEEMDLGGGGDMGPVVLDGDPPDSAAFGKFLREPGREELRVEVVGDDIDTGAKEPLEAGDGAIHRLSYTRTTEDTLRELQVLSKDGGKTWTTEYEVAWSRRK